MLHKRLNMLARSQPPRLALHIGKRAHEQRGPARLTKSIDNAGDKQIRDNGREQAPRPQYDKVRVADCIKRRRIRHDVASAAQLHVSKGRA